MVMEGLYRVLYSGWKSIILRIRMAIEAGD